MAGKVLTDFVDKLSVYNSPILGQDKKELRLSDLPVEKKEVLEKVLLLYQCKPKDEYFDMYHEKAIFEDPICNASNRHEIRVQFTMMAVVFTKSETLKVNLLQHKNNEIILDMFVWYYIPPFSIPVPIRSQVRLLFNEDNKILYHGDYWFHSTYFDRSKGLIGLAWNSFRRLNAVGLPYVAPLVTKIPKN